MAHLADVNSRDLLGAIRLGCRTMERVFDADDPHGVAFFDAVAWPEPRLSFSPVHSEAHVPGRHLNALLAAEGLLGIEVDPAAVDRHAAALFFSYSGDLPLPLNRVRRDGPLGPFCPHNLREGFHGLAALARWRGSEQAVETARRSVALIADALAPAERLAVPIDPDCANLTHVQSLGRAIGPLVKLWRSTGEQAVPRPRRRGPRRPRSMRTRPTVRSAAMSSAPTRTRSRPRCRRLPNWPTQPPTPTCSHASPRSTGTGCG